MYECTQFGSLGYSSLLWKVSLVLEVLQNGGSIVSMPKRERLHFPLVTDYVHPSMKIAAFSMKIAALNSRCYPCTEKSSYLSFLLSS